jgi:hypothetical protein
MYLPATITYDMNEFTQRISLIIVFCPCLSYVMLINESFLLRVAYKKELVFCVSVLDTIESRNCLCLFFLLPMHAFSINELFINVTLSWGSHSALTQGV